MMMHDGCVGVQVDAEVASFLSDNVARAVNGHWTLQRHVSLAPRCNKVCVNGWMDE